MFAHGWLVSVQHGLGAGGLVEEQIDGHHGQQLGRCHVSALEIGDVPSAAVRVALGTDHHRMQQRHQLAQVTGVGGSATVGVLAETSGAEEVFGIAPKQRRQIGVVAQRQIPRHSFDLDATTHGQGGTPQGAVDLSRRVADGLRRASPTLSPPVSS